MPLGHGHITLNPPVKLTMVKCKLLSKKCEGSNTMYISVKKVVETFGFKAQVNARGLSETELAQMQTMRRWQLCWFPGTEMVDRHKIR